MKKTAHFKSKSIRHFHKFFFFNPDVLNGETQVHLDNYNIHIQNDTRNMRLARIFAQISAVYGTTLIIRWKNGPSGPRRVVVGGGGKQAAGSMPGSLSLAGARRRRRLDGRFRAAAGRPSVSRCAPRECDAMTHLFSRDKARRGRRSCGYEHLAVENAQYLFVSTTSAAGSAEGILTKM